MSQRVRRVKFRHVNTETGCCVFRRLIRHALVHRLGQDWTSAGFRRPSSDESLQFVGIGGTLDKSFDGVRARSRLNGYTYSVLYSVEMGLVDPAQGEAQQSLG